MKIFQSLNIGKLLIAGPLLAGLYPLIRVTYPTIYSQINLTQISVVYLSFAFCFIIGLNTIKTIPIRINKTDLLITSYIIFSLINTFLKNDVSFFGKEIINTILTLIGYFCLRIIFTIYPNYSKQIVALSAILAVIASCAIALFQFFKLSSSFNAFFNVTGQFDNPNTFACYISLLFPYCILSYKIFRKEMRYVGYFCGLLIVCVDLICQSRSAILGLTIGSCLMYVNLAKAKSISIVIISSVVLLLATLICSFYFKFSSSHGRLLIWKISTNMVKDNFFTGTGTGGYARTYNYYQAAYFEKVKKKEEVLLADENYYTFNDFLRIQIEEGLIGTLIVFLLIFSLLPSKSHNNIPRANSSFLFQSKFSFVILLLIGCVNYPISEPVIVYYFLISVAAIATFSAKTGARFLLNIVAIRFVVLFVFLTMIYVAIEVSALLKWQKLNKIHLAKDKIEVLYKYERLYPFLKGSSPFLLSYAQVLGKYQSASHAISFLSKSKSIIPTPEYFEFLSGLYEKTSDFYRMEKCMIIMKNIKPHHFFPKYRLMREYINYGNVFKAKAIADEILNTPVKIPSMTVNEIKGYAKQIKTDL